VGRKTKGRIEPVDSKGNKKEGSSRKKKSSDRVIKNGSGEVAGGKTFREK